MSELLDDEKTLPEVWLPTGETVSHLLRLHSDGAFPVSDAVTGVMNNITLGIATGADRRFLAVMYFLNSQRLQVV